MSIEFGVHFSPESISYEDLLGDVLHCEALGYHSVWLSDHLVGMHGDPGNPRLECWTTVAALAADTSTIRLGQLVLCNPFRQPSLLAKMGATLDTISGGRLILGLGAGWHEDEFNAYGYPYEGAAVRVRRLDEAAQIIKKMWTEEAPCFEGRYYRIEEARCSPKPVQSPHPPLMLAGGGEQLTLRTVARHADISNFATWMGSPSDFRHKAEVLSRHCLDAGRDFDEITMSWANYTLISGDRGSAERSLDRYIQGMQASYGVAAGDRRPPLCGTPDDVIEQIQTYIDAGVTLFINRFMGEDIREEAALFAEEVIPSFNQA